MKYLEGRNDGFLAPFLDGCNQEVDIEHVNGKPTYLVIADDGEYTCNQTDGSAEGAERGEECADCGDRFPDGDGYWTGRFEDNHVCQSCQENNYRYAYGANGSQYYVHENDVEWVEGWDEYVDTDYLADNEVVRLENGGLISECDAVEVEDEWYHNDDDRIVLCVHDDEYRLIKNCVQLHDGEWALEDDAWKCHATSDWYLYDEVRPVMVDDESYHPDDAPESVQGELPL
jgi:hypothetical protein